MWLAHIVQLVSAFVRLVPPGITALRTRLHQFNAVLGSIQRQVKVPAHNVKPGTIVWLAAHRQTHVMQVLTALYKLVNAHLAQLDTTVL